MSGYSIESINVLPYPPLETTYSDDWKRIWTVEDRHNIIEIDVLNEFAERYREDIFSVSISLITDNQVTIGIVSKKHGGCDDMVVATGRLFNEFDKQFGPIKRIEGKPKEFWPMFRNNQSQFNQRYLHFQKPLSGVPAVACLQSAP